MLDLMELCGDLGARVATLEVRLSNQAARLLYQRFGFRPVGVRPRYYSDNGEDALIMTTESLRLRRDAPADGRDGPAVRAPCRSTRTPAVTAVSIRLLAIESSCDETAVAVVEDGRRIHANVVASQTALHAQTGGIVPEVAARAHLRWMIPVLEEACRQAGVDRPGQLDGIAVTQGPGLAGSLLVGITMARTLAWDTGLPLVPVNHLEGHIYAAWLLDPDEPEQSAPVFPLVALVVSGGHTFLVEMADHLHYRLLGQTVDDAAGRGLRQGRSAARAAVPGRAGHHGRGCHRDAPRPPLPARVDGRHRRLQLQRAEDRRAACRHGCARAGGRRRGAGRLAPARRGGRGAGLGVPGLGRRCARDADHARGCQVGARTVVMGGGVAANSVLRERIATGRSRPGHPARRAASGSVHRQRRDDRRGRLSTLRGG